MTGFTLAIIGGSGFSEIEGFDSIRSVPVTTPFGSPSDAIKIGQLDGIGLAFLARHGKRHSIPPHKINYRANIWALKHIGIDSILGIAAAGGIRSDMAPKRIVFPDQVIDYTYGRSATFFEEDTEGFTHIDFTNPYNEEIRKKLIAATKSAGLEAIESGTYGCTQGPRLESAAEIVRMERDGCDLVGMTGMPEAALARELDLKYACCAIIANWAAGKSQGPISMDEIIANLGVGIESVIKLLRLFVKEAS